jgi:hypothetical protein
LKADAFIIILAKVCLFIFRAGRRNVVDSGSRGPCDNSLILRVLVLSLMIAGFGQVRSVDSFHEFVHLLFHFSFILEL